MKAFKVNEAMEFDRSESNPLKKMDIGRGWRREVEDWVKSMRDIAILADPKINDERIKLADLPNDLNSAIDFDITELDFRELIPQHDVTDYNVAYVPKRMADEEDWGNAWGFVISDGNGEKVIEETRDWKKITKFFIKEKFGNISTIDKRLKEINKRIESDTKQKEIWERIRKTFSKENI